MQGIVFVCWFQLSLLESFFILAGFGGNGLYSIILLFCFLGYFLPFWGYFFGMSLQYFLHVSWSAIPELSVCIFCLNLKFTSFMLVNEATIHPLGTRSRTRCSVPQRAASVSGDSLFPEATLAFCSLILFILVLFCSLSGKCILFQSTHFLRYGNRLTGV